MNPIIKPRPRSKMSDEISSSSSESNSKASKNVSENVKLQRSKQEIKSINHINNYNSINLRKKFSDLED